MGFLSKLFSSGAGKFLEEAKGILDTVITTDKERDEAKYKLESLHNKYKAKAAEQVTKRHKNDMRSDSWLSKNVRPLVLIYSLAAITVFAVLDGAIGGFDIPKIYIQIVGQLLTAAIAFYFGSRSYDKKKVVDAVKDLKTERERTLQKRTDINPKDLPKVSLSPDEN